MSTVPFPLALRPPPRKSSGYISPFSSRAPFPYIIGRRRPLAPTSCVLPCFETFLSREPLSLAAPPDGPPFCISTSYWQIGPGTRPRRSGSAAPDSGGDGQSRISPEKSDDPTSLSLSSLFYPLTFHEKGVQNTRVRFDLRVSSIGLGARGGRRKEIQQPQIRLT